MFEKIYDELLSDGFTILEDCIEEKSIVKIQKEINNGLEDYLKLGHSNSFESFSKNFYATKKLISQHEIQVLLSKRIVNKGLLENLIFNEKVLNILSSLLGPDIEYLADFEMAINDKYETNNDYLFKKYHQEFWSGMGAEALQMWVPIYLLPEMGTIEIVQESHTWGHIPHKNREPIEMPKNYKSNILNINIGSIAIFTAFSLHRTVKNKLDEPRIAFPITVRNPYYPNTGNMDLFNFRKLKFSYYSRLRKILGNSQFSPFRILGQVRKDLTKK
tara:strand:+ start:15166 stop:15987 length:822 start_codon:yes stop_codon:yes gene_type:complete